MTEDEWDALVRRLDEKARADPSGYRLRVGALALVGYGFLAFAVLALLALAVLVVALAVAGPALLIKLLLPIGALIAIIARSLWIRIEPPSGIELKRGEAPELDRLVDETRATVDGPKVHTTLVDGELNAGVVQVPRLGIFGGQHNYLVLGLPLLQALGTDEFRAVLAHELGHLSKSHGRFGTWIYRVRGTWWKLLSTLEEQRRFGTVVFRRFFEWYAPYFNAYSFALARAHEYEADEAAVAAAGAPAAGTALARLDVASRHLHGSYWPRLYERSKHEPEPPREAFAPLHDELRTTGRLPEAAAWVDESLQLEATTTDTHPSLAERLHAIGVTTDEVKRRLTDASPTASAAEQLLGARLLTLVKQVDSDWRRAVAPGWMERHREVQASRRRIEELSSRTARLTDDEARELAHRTWDAQGDEDALPLFRDVLERDPRDAPANFAVGRILLARGDDDGLRHLDAAIEADPDAVLPACELAIGFLESEGRGDEAQRYRELGSQRYGALQLAQEERARPNQDGEVVAHDLPSEVVAETRRQLAAVPGVASAVLVRRRMDHLDDELPLYVLYVAPKRKLWRPLGGDREAFTERVVDALDLPYEFWVLSPGAFSTRLRDLRRRFPGGEIYRG